MKVSSWQPFPLSLPSRMFIRSEPINVSETAWIAEKRYILYSSTELIEVLAHKGMEAVSCNAINKLHIYYCCIKN
jgi:hypothetical protein